MNKSKSYYHCPNRNGCSSRYVEKSDLEKQVSDKFKNLQFTPEFINLVTEKIKSIFETKRNEYYAKRSGFQNRKNACEMKLKTVEDRLIDETLSNIDYIRIKNEIRTAIATIDSQMDKLEKTKETDIDVVSKILSLTKNIYNVYMQSSEQLQKKFIGFFFDRFEVENGLIIKTCYSPLFEELMHQKAVSYKTCDLKKPVINNMESNFIITPTWGDYSVMLRG